MDIKDKKICDIANSEPFKSSEKVFLVKLGIRFGCPGKSINELKQELIDVMIDIDPHIFDQS